LTINLQLIANIEEPVKKEIESIIQRNLENIFSQHDSEVPEIAFQYASIKQDFDKKLRRIQRNFEEDFLN
jgi:hypothetical protein